MRFLMLVAALAGLLWFSFINTASAREVAQLALDQFDGRPAQTILFIGNSRTFPHGMPYMVRSMADSANAPVKFQVRMHALPGRSLEDHWNNENVRQLLAETWDHVVIQAESSAHVTEETSESFLTFGERLVSEASSRGSRPTLFVGWNYGSKLFEDRPPGTEERYYRRIQGDHQRLADRTGARLANVGRVWKRLLGTNPSLQLMSDGNHPTLAGSYVTALVFYARLAEGGIESVTYVPSGLDEEEAAQLRLLVASALQS